MKVRRVIIKLKKAAFMLAGALLIAGGAGAAASADNGGSISGTVTDANNQPVANISVQAYASIADFNNGNNGNMAAFNNTDDQGNYTLSGLPAGDYYVVFNLQGGGNPDYVQLFYNGQTTIESADMVTVADGAVTPNINAQLPTAGHVTGRVTDTAGAPLAGIRVDAYASVAAYGDGSNTRSEAIAQTGDDGTYDMGAIPEGNYLLVFNQGGGGNNPQYVTDFYNNQPTIGMAQWISVTAGATTPNINATLAVPAQISGRVTDLNGTGIDHILVTVYASLSDYQNGIIAAGGHTEADGTYTLGGLHPGTYIVGFNQNLNMMYHANYQTQFYNLKPAPEAADWFTVTAGQTVTHIDARLGMTGGPTDKQQCKKGGWRNFVDPAFKNQGQCISYVTYQ